MTYLFKLAHRISKLRLPALAALLSVAACSKGEKTDFLSPNPNRDTPVLSLIRVEPQINSVQVGSELQFTATGYSTTGVIIPVTVDWSATGGIVTADGRYTGVLTGNFTVKATAREKPAVSDSARVGVWETGDELVALVVSPDSAIISEGDTVEFSAALRMARGALTGSASVSWSASGGDLTPSGRFTAPEQGEYVVSAMSVNNLRGSARVFVRPKTLQLQRVRLSPTSATVTPGQEALFAATAEYDNGTSGAADVEWSSTGGTIAGGLFRAGGSPGTYAVVATDWTTGMADSATVAVVPPAITRIVVSPSSASLAPGAHWQFGVQAQLADGSWQSVQSNWQASGGLITQSGGYTAPVTPGTYRIIVTSPATPAADTAIVTVVQTTATLNSVVVDPSSVTLAAGGTRQFTVMGAWSDGTSSTPAVTWTATGGTINAAGIFTAGASAGSFAVIATAGNGRADTSAVTVTASVLTSLQLAPAAVSRQTGQTQQFTVSATWSDGATTVPAVTYAASGGTITAGGLYTAGQTAGTFSVIAAQSGGGLADTSFVTIASAPPTLSGVSLTPTSAVLAPGAVQQFTAVGVYSNGSTGSVSISWSQTGGSINNSGRYTAGATPGTYRVIARQSGSTRADTSIVTITSPPTVTSLTVSPKPANMQIGTTAQFAASATWSDGATTVPPIVWTSTGGSITSAGRYTAGAAPGTFRVVASHQGGTKSDTSVVTLTAAPPPTVTLTALIVSPKPTSLQVRTSKQFTVSATWSDGSSSVPSLTWSATGGTITSGGVYTAGSTAGIFRAIATGGGKADTSIVTITTPPVATLSSLSIAPKPASVLKGAVQQFTASAVWSDGSTTLPALTWSATGGTISGGGLYTAGSTAGTFRAIVTGGTRADTAVVTITASTPAPSGVVFSDDFESGLGQWEDVNSVHIGTAQAHSGTKSLELSYAAGSSDAGWAWRKGLVPDQAAQHDQYVRWWQRWSPGFSFYNGSGSDQKLIQLQALSPRDGWAQTANWKMYLHLVGQSVSGVSPTTLYPERFIWDGTSQWSGQWQGFAPSAPSPYVADRWICTEVQIKHNTPGQPNGELRVWVDGALTTQQTGVKFRDAAVSWNALQVTGYYDGGSPKAQTSWVDDIAVSTQRIGCGDTVPVSPPPPPPPVVPPPASGAWLTETFGGFSSFAGIQGASWYQVSDYTNASRISVDLTDGAPGGSDRSMKYDFPSGSGGVGILMRLPVPVTEYWTEIWAKFSPNYASGGSCNGNNPDYKFVFWALQPGDGRNEIKVGNYGDMHNLDARYDAGPDVLRISTPAQISSGQWHRYRAHNRVGSNAVFSVEFWDGVNAPQVLKQTGFSLSFTSMDYIVLGANRNCDAATAMWMKYGKITLYNSDPGWGF